MWCTYEVRMINGVLCSTGRKSEVDAPSFRMILREETKMRQYTEISILNKVKTNGWKRKHSNEVQPNDEFQPYLVEGNNIFFWKTIQSNKNRFLEICYLLVVYICWRHLHNGTIVLLKTRVNQTEYYWHKFGSELWIDFLYITIAERSTKFHSYAQLPVYQRLISRRKFETINKGRCNW